MTHLMLGPEMTHLLHFVHYENFPENIKTVTFIHFLKLFTRYCFKKSN